MIRQIAAGAALFLMLPGVGWSADKVKLTTLDGSRVIEGDLASFDGAYFRVVTEYGSLTLDAGDVRCEGNACPAAEALVALARVGGPADMIHRLMPPLLERFADLESLDFRHIFTSDDSVTWQLAERETGQLLARIEGVVAPETEVLTQLASREAQISLGRTEGGLGVDQDVIALDALVPAVSIENPRAMISLDEFRALLGGKITNWSQLGDPDLTLALHLPDDAGAVAVVSRVFPGLRLGKGTWHSDPREQATAVSDDPGALGLLPLSRLGNTIPLVIGGPCGLSTPATRATVKSEDYPLTRPLFLHRIGARQPRIIRDFIGFARSYEAQPVIRAAGFLDQGIGRIPFDRQGDRLAKAVLAAGDDQARLQEVQRMIAGLLEGERLTLTFRFQDGSTDLNAQSRSNIRRLTDAISRGEFDGKELVFVGFTDGDGPADANLRLSNRRAQTVRRAVMAFSDGAPVTLTATGFGEIMPMACDDTPWGRQVNRRVEVWVRAATPQSLR